MPSGSISHKVLAGQFRYTVDLKRVRERFLVVWLVLIATEHIVRADMNELGLQFVRDLCEIAHGVTVHVEGTRWVRLTPIELVEGGKVDDD
jgi:hypothetical protein